MSAPNYSREDLIAICEAASVPEASWWDRDSKGAQTQVGEALMLLKAGCSFDFSDDPLTDERTIWIRVRSEGFNAFEMGRNGEYHDADLFYLPTLARLAERPGKDWY